MKRIHWFLLMICALPMLSFAEQQVGVIDLEAPGFDAQVISTLSNKLRSELVKTGLFLVLERNQMTEILKEQGFQNTGCTSSECAVQMGQLLGVQIMVAGTVGRVGQTWLITLRLIDVRDGKITKMVDYEMEGLLDDILKHGIANAARKLAGLSLNEFKPTAVLVQQGALATNMVQNCDSSLVLGSEMAVKEYSLFNGWYVASTLFLFSYTAIYHFMASPPTPDLNNKEIRAIKGRPGIDYDCFKEGFGAKAKSRRGTSVLLGTLTCIGALILITAPSSN